MVEEYSLMTLKTYTLYGIGRRNETLQSFNNSEFLLLFQYPFYHKSINTLGKNTKRTRSNGESVKMTGLGARFRNYFKCWIQFSLKLNRMFSELFKYIFIAIFFCDEQIISVGFIGVLLVIECQSTLGDTEAERDFNQYIFK